MIEWTSATLFLRSILANCVQSFRQWKSSVHLCTSSSFPHLTGLRTGPPTTTFGPWSSLCPLVGSPASTMHYSIALKNSSEGSLQVQKARVPLPSSWGVVTLSGVPPDLLLGLLPATELESSRSGHCSLSLHHLPICHVPIKLQLWVKSACMLF